MAGEKIKLFELEIDGKKVVETLDKSRKEVKKLNEEIKKLSESEEDNGKEIEALTIQRQQEQAQIRKVQKETKNLISTQEENVGTLRKLKNENKALRDETFDLNLETEKGQQRLAEINNQLDINNAVIKENADAYLKTKITVGDYSNEIKKALKDTDLMSNSTEQLSEQFPAVADGVSVAKKAFNVLAKNPLIFAITALVGTLTLVFNAFKKTQKGADTMGKITASLSAVMDVFTGILAGVAETLIGVFENPQQALKDFSALVKDNIVSRFEGLLKLIPRLGEAIGLLFEGEFAASAKVAADAVSQVAFGVENLSDKAGDAFNSIAEDIDKAVDSAINLKNAQIALQNSIIASTTTLAKLNAEAEKQEQIVGDSTKSFAELAEASEAARVAREKAGIVEVALAQKELGLQKLIIAEKRRNGLVTRELRQTEADLIAAVIDAESKSSLIIAQNATERNLIRQDEVEKNLDYLLDNFDNIKTLNEKIISNEKVAFEKRQALLNETRRLGTKSFGEQITELQTLSDGQINANDLLAESDSKRLIEKVRLLNLSEIGETRLLEVLRDRRTELSDLAEFEVTLELSKVDKLAAIAEKTGEFELAERAREYEIAKENIFATNELRREDLKTKKDQEIASAKEIGKDTTLIEAKYSADKEAINKAENDAKLSLAGDFLGNIASIAGKGTGIGKAAAAAQTTISTIQGAQAAFTGMIQVVPGPIGIGLGIAAAGAALKSGYDNVKSIYAVKSGLPEGAAAAPAGGGISVPSVPSAGADPIAAANNSVSAQVGQGIVSRDSLATGQQQASVQTAVIIDNVTAKQNSQSQNDVTRNA